MLSHSCIKAKVKFIKKKRGKIIDNYFQNGTEIIVKCEFVTIYWKMYFFQEESFARSWYVIKVIN